MDKSVISSAILLALIGVVALNIKSIFSWIWQYLCDNILYSLKVEESSQFFYAIQNYIAVEKSHVVKNTYYRTIYDNFIDGETTRDVQVFYNRGLLFTKGLMISKSNMVLTNTTTPYKNEKQSFFIYTWRKSNLLDFIKHVKINYVDSNIRYYFNNNGDIMAYGKVSNKNFDNIFLNDGLVGKIKNDLDVFLRSKEDYNKLGLKYKRNYLFYGSAGGGKSSLATAIANYTKRDILAVNLSKDMTDSTLIALIARRPQRSIVLFEDIDCLFEELNRTPDKAEDGKEKTPMMKITLSCILNILDGSFTPNDTIFVITTNHIDKLDPALIRDGRINFKAEIELPNKETKAAYIKYLAANNPKFKVEDVDLDKDVPISTLEKNLF